MERLLACVLPPMAGQVGASVEVLPALRAAEGLLPCVDPPVRGKVGQLAEALPALPALVRPLARVDALVGRQVRALTEALPALWTPVLLLLCPTWPRAAPLCLVGDALPAISLLHWWFLRRVPQAQRFLCFLVWASPWLLGSFPPSPQLRHPRTAGDHQGHPAFVDISVVAAAFPSISCWQIESESESKTERKRNLIRKQT